MDSRTFVRSLKPLLAGISLVSVGVVVGLLLASTLPRGFVPETTGTTVLAATVAAEDGSDLRVPDALLYPPAQPSTPLESPFVALARKVVPAVVSVESRRTVRGGSGMNGPLRRFFDNDDEDDEEDEGLEVPSSGSGFIFDGSGFVFTNDHVVTGSHTVNVHLADGRTYEAWLVGTDPGTDVAVLKVDLPSGDDPLPTLPLGNSDEIRVGDWAIAVGNPLGELESSMTLGIVSAKGRKDLRIAGGGPTYQDFIQTDASINFGNSGGPLVNARGEVVGINSAINPSGQGLGFTIPINMARKVGLELIQSGTIRRGFLGVFPQEVTETIRSSWGVADEGILVGSVEAGTPAEAAGLRVGDVILEFNRSEVEDVPQFRSLVAEAGVGVDVPILFLRDGDERSVNVVLAERPDTQEPPSRRSFGGEAPGPFLLGITIRDINSRLAKDYDLALESGVVVTGVRHGGRAHRQGLREGDVILEVNRERVESSGQLEAEIERLEEARHSVVFLVQRGESTTFVEIPAG